MLSVHPELAPILDRLPNRPENPYTDMPALRAEFRALIGDRAAEPDARVTVEPLAIAGASRQPLHGQIVRPRNATGVRPGVLYLHGGGFAYGELDGPSPMVREVAATVGAVVLHPHYRLAPEHRLPAGVEDCYATLAWFTENAAEFGVDPARIAVCGASAGGNLAAALTLMSRDRGGPPIAFQSLLIPVVDDRGDTPSRRAITDRRIINGPAIAHTWDTYLGPDRDPATTSAYGAGTGREPARPAARVHPRLRTGSTARRGHRLRRPPSPCREQGNPAPRAGRLALLRGLRAHQRGRARNDRPLAGRYAQRPPDSAALSAPLQLGAVAM